MSAELELVAGHGDPLIFEVPDMPPCMLHMMLRLEESRNKEQRKAGGFNYDILDELLGLERTKQRANLSKALPRCDTGTPAPPPGPPNASHSSGDRRLSWQSSGRTASGSQLIVR
jgi:hypothetical protein